MVFNDFFWLSAASLLFVMLAFKPVKKYITNFLDDQIDSIKNNLKQAEKLYKDSEVELRQLQSEYKDTITNKNNIIEKARLDAQNIVTEAKIKATELIEQYDRVAQERMMTLEKEFINNTKKLILEEALKSIKKDMKKNYLNSDNDTFINKRLINL